MIFLVYCIASLFYYVLVLSPALRDIFSYFYGAILPVCAESAVKPQTKERKRCICICMSLAVIVLIDLQLIIVFGAFMLDI